MMKKTALRYVSRGLYVIPLETNGKRPHKRLAPHGAKSATNSPEDVNRIWDNAPHANIGIVAAVSRFHVIDVDVKQGDGIAELDALQEQYGKLPQTATAYTPSGGFHLYFRTWANGLPSRKLSKNIDTRGHNAYVVAPPSVVAGTRYAWAEYSGVALLPAWVRDIMQAEPTAAATAIQGAAVGNVGDVMRRGFVPDYVRELMRSEGNANEDDFAIVSALVKRGLSDTAVSSVFMSFPCGHGLKRKKKPDYYLSLTIERARARVRSVTPYTVNGEVLAW